MMNNLVATASDETWTYSQLMKNALCHFCNRLHYNNWYSCNRRSSMVNLHPGLVCITRQHWYVIKIVAKYAINNYPTSGQIPFQGHPGATTELRSYVIPDISLPQELQNHLYVAHGNNNPKK